MKVIKPSWEIVNEPDWDEVIIALEKAIRTCYKSEKKIDAGTADRLIRSIISRGHESTLEHASMTVRFTCDRGVSHEFVRHRHCGFSQESTRYVNYSVAGKYTDGDMKFILPEWMPDHYVGTHYLDDTFMGETTHGVWLSSMLHAEAMYNNLIQNGWKAEQARSVLPNSLKTELVMTANMREWRHIFKQRCDKTAHPQARELMIPLWEHLAERCPTLFDSVEFNR